MSLQVNNSSQFQNPKLSKEATKQAFDQMAAYFSQLGLAKSDLHELFSEINARTSSYSSAGLHFGQDLSKLSSSDLSRFNETGVSHFFNRKRALDTLQKGLGSSQDINSFYNFIAYTQNLYKEATGNEDASPILRELIGAAQRGIEDLPQDKSLKLQLKNLLESNPQNAIFNPHIFAAAQNELAKRHALVSEINGQSAKSDSFFGRFAQFGLGGSLTLGALIGGINKPARMLTDWAVGNKFSWGNDPLKTVGRGNALSRYLNKDAGITNYTNLAKEMGWKATSYGNFRPTVTHLAQGKVSVSFPDGTKAAFDSVSEWDDAAKALKKTAYTNHLAQSSKEFVKAEKEAIKAARTGWKKLLPASLSRKLLGARAKEWTKFLPKRLGWIAAALAAVGYVGVQASKNPNWSETAENTYEGTAKTVNGLTGGAVQFASDWFVPDFGTLYGDPWKDENKAQNILEGAYA